MSYHSVEWLAGYQTARKQAATMAKLYQDELNNLCKDTILQRQLINMDGLIPAGLEAADIASFLANAAFLTAHDIANTISNLQPPSLNIPVEQIAAAFQIRR